MGKVGRVWFGDVEGTEAGLVGRACGRGGATSCKEASLLVEDPAFDILLARISRLSDLAIIS